MKLFNGILDDEELEDEEATKLVGYNKLFTEFASDVALERNDVVGLGFVNAGPTGNIGKDEEMKGGFVYKFELNPTLLFI